MKIGEKIDQQQKLNSRREIKTMYYLFHINICKV